MAFPCFELVIDWLVKHLSLVQKGEKSVIGVSPAVTEGGESVLRVFGEDGENLGRVWAECWQSVRRV